MKIPDEMWEYAKKEYENLEFGEVRIIANESSKGVDVVVEKRKRFQKEETQQSQFKKEFKKG